MPTAATADGFAPATTIFVTGCRATTSGPWAGVRPVPWIISKNSVAVRADSLAALFGFTGLALGLAGLEPRGKAWAWKLGAATGFFRVGLSDGLFDQERVKLAAELERSRERERELEAELSELTSSFLTAEAFSVEDNHRPA